MPSGTTHCVAAAPHGALLFLALAGVLCACSGRKGGALQAGVPVRDSLSCGTGAAADSADPWLPTDSHYARTAVQGDRRDAWFDQISGAAWVEHRLYVFDAARAHVLVFDDRLRAVEDSFGRQGEGPGEFQGVYAPNLFGVARRLMPGGQGRLIVFDGYRFQRFGADGRYLGVVVSTQAMGEAGLTPNMPRFGWAHDSLYFFAGGYDGLSFLSRSAGSSPAFYGGVEARGHRRDLVTLPLPRLPKDRRGVTMVGPRQARPVWALGPECLWATGGSRPVFYRVRRDATGRDSIVLHLHLPDPSPEEDAGAGRLLRQMGGAGSFPKPSALSRIHDLLFDPAGRLWMRLNPLRSRDSSVAVAVLDPDSGTVVDFQAPEFPLVFGAPGVFYAAARDSMGRPLIARFAVAPATASTSSHP